MAAKTAAGVDIRAFSNRPAQSKDSASALASLFKQHKMDIHAGPDNKTKEDSKDREQSMWGKPTDPSGMDALSRQSDLNYDPMMLGHLGNV
jgi:hypothetical protein